MTRGSMTSERQSVPGLRVATRPGVGERFATQVRAWAEEVLERAGDLPKPASLCVTIWKGLDELREFYQREKEELGIITGEEADFLATHEAWRGYPRIHLCQERLVDLPDELLRGALHHEIGHALHHGGPEFYSFRFSSELVRTGRSCGLDRAPLQHLVYLLSVAIKDGDVTRWLTQVGLGAGQGALLAHMMSDTEDERGSWEMARGSPGLRSIVVAALLKTLLPIQDLLALRENEGPYLRDQWEAAYGWLSRKERVGLVQFARRALRLEAETFQDRLEQTALSLLTDPNV